MSKKILLFEKHTLLILLTGRKEFALQRYANIITKKVLKISDMVRDMCTN